MGLSTKGPISSWDKSWAREQTFQRGASAAMRGVPYSANPERSPAGRLAWSQGHNGRRVTHILFKDKYGWPDQ